MQTRQNALMNWLNTTLADIPFTVTPLAGDASFRRYFRLHSDGMTRVIMDAPPSKESIAPFVSIAGLLAQNGVYTPKVIAVDYSLGFALLEDLGDELLLKALSQKSADRLYTLAMDTLMQIQRTPISNSSLPFFDKPFMNGELSLFIEWFLRAYLNMTLHADDAVMLNQTFDWLTTQIASQPLVFIHRDYHSRNLIVTDDALGVIDFQDAMQGPVTYDLVSLLKDCYVQWPAEDVAHWLAYFYQKQPSETRGSLTQFTRAFDFCGLQRHLKVLGVFCRLHLRDNKSTYLGDLPMTFNYTMACLETYEELRPFYRFMQERVRDVFLQKVNS